MREREREPSQTANKYKKFAGIHVLPVRNKEDDGRKNNDEKPQKHEVGLGKQPPIWIYTEGVREKNTIPLAEASKMSLPII